MKSSKRGVYNIQLYTYINYKNYEGEIPKWHGETLKEANGKKKLM